MIKGSKLSISKTQFIKGLQCPKALWYYINRKDLSPEVNIAAQARFDAGTEVGLLAQEYFDGGVEITEKYWEIEEAVNSTKKLIEQGINVIYEATAIDPNDGSYSRIDIFRKNSETNKWDLIEVKSSTGVKDYHMNDLSFQYHVFSKAGYEINRCYVMVINNQYIRDGDIDPKALFILEDISESVLGNQSNIDSALVELCNVPNMESEPTESIGARCFSPFECDYTHHCWNDVPEYSIYDVYSAKKADEIYQKIKSFEIDDVPEDLLPGGRKGIDVDCYQNRTQRIDVNKIRNFLESFDYPIYYFDYETVMPGVPLYNGTRPYQHVPFQFSLHIQDTPDAELRHFEYLHKDQSDPRLLLAETLIQLCGDKGSILVYNETFEKGRNIELANVFPQYAEELEAINDRILDLMEPFSKRWLYKPEQMSSYSIKYVLPAYVPELSYNDLAIRDGGEASETYFRFVKGLIDEKEQETLWSNLTEYCKLDTYAMVRLLEELKKVVG